MPIGQTSISFLSTAVIGKGKKGLETRNEGKKKRKERRMSPFSPLSRIARCKGKRKGNKCQREKERNQVAFYLCVAKKGDIERTEKKKKKEKKEEEEKERDPACLRNDTLRGERKKNKRKKKGEWKGEGKKKGLTAGLLSSTAHCAIVGEKKLP